MYLISNFIKLMFPTTTFKGILERLFNLTIIFLECGGKPEYLESTHAYTAVPQGGIQIQILL